MRGLFGESGRYLQNESRTGGSLSGPARQEMVMSTHWTRDNELPTLDSEPAEISRFVVEAAMHAPSVLNTQPWWFSTADREISLHADVDRRLRVADPPGREMMISCAAALFNARVALR